METTIYNPYISALEALTNADARRFYLRTAFEHLDLMMEAGHNCFQAGQAVRKWHDDRLIPIGITIYHLALQVAHANQPRLPEGEVLEVEEAPQPQGAGAAPYNGPGPQEAEQESPDPQEAEQDGQEYPPQDWEAFFRSQSYQELRHYCKEVGLPASGRKDQLISRLAARRQVLSTKDTV